MNATEITFGIVFLLQISCGISANVFLLLFYICMISASNKLSSSDLILAHLAFANSVVLLSFGIPETMSAWGWKNFLDDFGCKIFNYLYRVARGLSICTTCFLSVFQAITISPSTSSWAEVKAKLPKYIVPFCGLSWILNMLVDIDVLMYITGPQNRSSVQIILDLKYCLKHSAGAEANLIIAIMLSLRDLFFVGLMSVASGYMAFILNRHHKRVQNLLGLSHSLRVNPEIRAAKKVTALATLYVLLYGRHSVMLSVLLNMKEKSPLLLNSHIVFSFTFSVISPFLMIHNDRRMRTFWKRESHVSNKVLN
ncbi:vomeronasal 1 receptor ornAnaV1R3174 [Ornithorhynchus anatinus]|uniref:Vomeronasal type-1 receptor n=1 Tax=Ornithorhynchus anatinus TaxID=9258 RepID=A0A6I8NEW8_ORNAN|nr:vomeronasal 1 receptor ornAnaV1R3174 [Ornithorhynchus anatinus]